MPTILHGDVVEFTGDNATEFQIERASKYLSKGSGYTVVKIFSDTWGSHLYFEGLPNKSFNSDMFAHTDKDAELPLQQEQEEPKIKKVVEPAQGGK